MDSIVLVIAMLPLWSVADTWSEQPLVEQTGQAAAGTVQAMPAWIEPPAGPYQFFPPQTAGFMEQPVQPDAGQAGMLPDPSAGQMPLPAPDSGYAYEYPYRYQPPVTSVYGYDRTMPPPGRAYDYDNYPRSNYPAGMMPDYYPYGPARQMPVQPYYR